MVSKSIFVAINTVSLLILIIVIRFTAKNTEDYAKDLRRLMISAGTAVLAYIYIALTSIPLVAEIAFCFYFGAMNWISYFLMTFCLKYTRHYKIVKGIKLPFIAGMLLDTILIFLNPIFKHEFYLYPYMDREGERFFLYKSYIPYYSHLVLDYLAIVIGLIALIFAIIKSYSFYRVKYLIIFAILVGLILMNGVYMTLALPLDWSVMLYAIASLVFDYYCMKYAPNNLITRIILQATGEMNEGLVMFDNENKCVFINDFVKKYMGVSSPEECSMDSAPIKAVVEGDPIKIGDDEIRHIIMKGENGNRDERFRVHFSSLNDEHRHQLGSYFRIELITDEYNNMKELEKARIEANRANVAKSSFLANMSHEIRTPINSVLGMNEMVLRECDDPQVLEYAQNIQSAGNTLLGLINDILDFSKVEAGKMDLVNDTYNVHKILRDALHMLEARANEKGLKLIIDCDENVPSGLYGDENRIRQILTNLMTNAIKYTKEGTVSVLVSSEKLNDESVSLKFEIKDTGIGISEENQKVLFNAFQRVDENINRNIEGTGLGLAITNQLVSLMKGEITVESEIGTGSTFTVVIPQIVKDMSPVGAFKRTEEVKKNSYKENFTAPDAYVLVVDDVPMNLKVVQALLKKTKLNIDTADGGIEAFEKCKQKKYDLILMDHMMPEPDGIATLGMIRKEGMNKDSNVIVLTANAINGVDKEYREAGFVDYLAKPVRGSELEEMINKYLPEDKIWRN